MHMPLPRFLGWSVMLFGWQWLAVVAWAEARPNILVILADDLGYADVGFQGCKDIPTPHLDALAKDAVHCTEGYVSHPFCSPTRAGLLTGRYQQRFGHENNPAWRPEDPRAGLPLSQTTLADALGKAGYVTGCVGKWHLGAHPSFHPNQRGFQHYYGALGGGHIYLPGLAGGEEYSIPMDRNGQPEPLSDYITTSFGREASKFIRESSAKPWCLYLAFNAPHTPLQSTEALKARLGHIQDTARRDLAALIVGLDDAIGEVIQTLRAEKLYDNTFIVFMSDNGGPITVSKCSNGPLRAGKGTVYEGGIRVPFLISWPSGLPRGTTYEQPVVSLDVFRTALGLAGVASEANSNLEGVDLLPYLRGDKEEGPHNAGGLFWRTGGGASWAVRQGKWKAVGGRNQPTELYNLTKDKGEAKDVAGAKAEVVQRLEAAYAQWNTGNIEPIFESPRAGKKPAKSK